MGSAKLTGDISLADRKTLISHADQFAILLLDEAGLYGAGEKEKGVILSIKASQQRRDLKNLLIISDFCGRYRRNKAHSFFAMRSLTKVGGVGLQLNVIQQSLENTFQNRSIITLVVDPNH